MNCVEYGKQNQDVLIFLHGGGLSWWNYREEAELLGQDYHVVLPILDGHAGSDRPFTGIEDNASEIIEYVDQNFGGQMLMMGGLSLGAQILLEILSKRGDICRHALVESAAVLPARLTHAMIAKAVGSSYGLIKNRAFAKLQFRSLHIKASLFEDYYRDTCLLKKSDMIAFLEANTSYELKDSIRGCRAKVQVFAGKKEKREIIKSARAIKEALPDCKVNFLDGLRHGEFSLNKAEKYAEQVRRMLS